MRTFVTQSRIASLIASLSVRVPGVDAAHLGAEEPHPLHVRGLARHVLGAHVDDALEAEERADGGGRDPVLAGAGLGDHPGLAHALHEEGLAEGVVDLVGAGVAEVLALQPHAAAEPLREPRREAERRGAADVVAEEPLELGLEGRVAPRRARRPPRARGAAP